VARRKKDEKQEEKHEGAATTTSAHCKLLKRGDPESYCDAAICADRREMYDQTLDVDNLSINYRKIVFDLSLCIVHRYRWENTGCT
jgi:hypothetical protein